MKKILFVSVAILAFASCRKVPNVESLTYQFIVATNHDSTANFSNYKKYYMSDKLTLIGDDANDSVVDGSIGDPIVAAIGTNMANRGFTRVSSPDSADVGINTAVIKVTTTVVYYPPYYWWGYPGYGGCYYGYCGGYYPYYPYYGYGYTQAYSYTTGSLMLQMADLVNVDTVNHKIRILWTNFNTGVLGSTSGNVTGAVNAVNQAFTQSAYLKTN
jgi:hypothetical protein